MRSALREISDAAGRIARVLDRLPSRDRTDEAKEDLRALRARLSRCGTAADLLARERDALRALSSVGQAVNSSLDLAEVLDLAMDHIIELTGAERGFLMLRGEQSGELEFKVARGVDSRELETAAFQVSRTVVNEVATQGMPVITMNAQADPRYSDQESVLYGQLLSLMCVPLRIKERVTGVIYADNRAMTGVFEDHELDVLVAFADQAAVAIENAKLFEKVTRSLEAITEMKNLMDNVFASMASAVVTIDLSEQVQLMNRAAEEIFRVTEAEAVGRPYDEALSGAGEFASLLEEVKARQSVITQEVSPVFPDRGAAAWRMSLSPVKDASAKPTGVTLVVDDLTEQRFVKETLGRYVGPRVMQRLLSDSHMVELGGERRRVSVLFADIRGFTSFSENLEPEKLIGILNRYLGLAADAVMNAEGTLDKFMGDAVMAMFNAPLHQEDHVLCAVRAAIAMQRATSEHHLDIPPEERVSFGVGINVGDAVVGNVGNVRQQDYTAIGDCVNYARRLQEHAGPGQILVSRAVWEEVGDHVEVNELPALSVKGRSRPEPVFEVLAVE
jgi:PAS domain S-box-containing protein